MRKNVKYILLNPNINKYMFKGVSLEDMQLFSNEFKIPKDKIMIFQDIPQISEEVQTPLHAVKYVTSIKRRTNKFYTGNDCFIVTNEKSNELFKKSCDDIFYSNDDSCFSKEILLMFYVHDIDWLAIVIFNEKELKNNFFNFIKRHSKLIMESNIDVFYD